MQLIVGQIFRPHGIRGEVTVDPRTDEPDARFTVGSVLVTDSSVVRRLAPVPADGAWQVPPTLTIESVRPHQNKLLVVFEGIYDRNLAEELKGVLLTVDSSTVLPSDDPEEFNDHQLVGLAAVDPDGTPLGEVVRVDHAPASDLLVVRQPDGRTSLVPFVLAIVPEVDLAGGRVIITAPEGLFDL